MAKLFTPKSPEIIDLTLSPVKRPPPQSRIDEDCPPTKRRLTFTSPTSTTTAAPVVVDLAPSSPADDSSLPSKPSFVDESSEYGDLSGSSWSTPTIPSRRASEDDDDVDALWDDEENYLVKELYIRITHDM